MNELVKNGKKLNCGINSSERLLLIKFLASTNIFDFDVKVILNRESIISRIENSTRSTFQFRLLHSINSHAWHPNRSNMQNSN